MTASPERRLILTVHGIRTFGRWQGTLAALVAKELDRGAGSPVDVVCYKYSYFSAIAYLILPLRWIEAARFRKWFESVVADGNYGRLDCIAHSFGTYLLGTALLSRRAHARERVHTVILAGSVLPARFPWHQVLGRSVRRVVNDCGIYDWVVVLNGILPFSGSAGRLGFTGLLGTSLVNRFFPLGHSGFFYSRGASSSRFMLRWWIPLLREQAQVRQVDFRSMRHGEVALTLCAKNATLVKAVCYLALLVTGCVTWVSTRPASYRVPLEGTSNGPQTPVSDAAISPTGKQFVYADTDGLHIRSVNNSSPVTIGVPGDRVVVETAWGDQGGAVLAALSSRSSPVTDLWKYVLDQKSWQQLVQMAHCGSMSPNGNMLAYMRDQREIWVRDLQTAADRLVRTFGAGEYANCPSWSPNSRSLAYARWWKSTTQLESAIEVVDARSGERWEVLSDRRLHLAKVGMPKSSLCWQSDAMLLVALAETRPRSGSNLWLVPVGWHRWLYRALGYPKQITNLNGRHAICPTAALPGSVVAYVETSIQTNVVVASLSRDTNGGLLHDWVPYTQTQGFNEPSAWRDNATVIFTSDRQNSSDILSAAGPSNTPIALAETREWEFSGQLLPGGRGLLYLLLRDEIPRRPPHLDIMARVDEGAASLVRAVPIPPELMDRNPLEFRLNYRLRCSGMRGGPCLLSVQDGDSVTFQTIVGEAPRMTDPMLRVHLNSPDDFGWDLSTDGRKLMLVEACGDIRVIDLETGGEQTGSFPSGRLQHVAYLPNSEAAIATVMYSDRFGVVSINADASVSTMVESATAYYHHPVVAPDVRHVAFGVTTWSTNVWTFPLQ